MEPGHVFISGSFIGRALLPNRIHVAVVDLCALRCIEVKKKDDGGFFPNDSLALLRGQLLLEALGHLGRRRPVMMCTLCSQFQMMKKHP